MQRPSVASLPVNFYNSLVIWGLHIKNSLNYKYIVLSLLIRSVTILKNTIANAIWPCNLIFASKILYRNIFLILLDLSIKKYLDLCLII